MNAIFGNFFLSVLVLVTLSPALAQEGDNLAPDQESQYGLPANASDAANMAFIFCSGERDETSRRNCVVTSMARDGYVVVGFDEKNEPITEAE